MSNFFHAFRHAVLRGLIAFALVIILISSCVPVLADMNIDISSVEAGEAVYVSWNKFSDADHYEYSVHDLKTDELFFNRESTTKLKFKIPGSRIIAGHSYRVWVGAIVEGVTEIPYDYQNQQVFDVADVELSLTATLSGSSVRISVSGSSNYTTFVSLVDRNDNAYSSQEEIGMKKSATLTPSESGRFRYKVVVRDEDTRVQATAYSGYYNFELECQHDNTWYDDKDGEYVCLDSNYHQYYYTYDLVCADCDKIIYTGVPGSNSKERHDFNSKDVCTICKYDDNEECRHDGATTRKHVKRNGLSISDTQHKLIDTYDIKCSKCGEVFRQDEETSTKSHIFNTNGDCTECNYRASCLHASTTLEVYSTSYRLYDDKEHEIYTLSRRVCANASCGVIRESGIVGSSFEPHAFSGDSCTDCGYTKADELTISLSRGQSAAETGGTISASVSIAGGSGAYRIAWEVFFNGASVETTDYTQQSTFSYPASKEGAWKFKVYVKDRNTDEVATATTKAIDVQDGACKHDRKTEKELRTEYEKMSDTKHNIYVYIQMICDNCGEAVGGEYRKPSGVGDHAFDKKGVCACGITKPSQACDHKDAYEELIDAQLVTIDATTHLVISTYREVCPCGAVLHAGREYNEIVAHKFVDGKCACGQKKVEDESTKVPPTDKPTKVPSTEKPTKKPSTPKPTEEPDDKPVCRVHESGHVFDGDEQYEAMHPHEMYKTCDCGYALYLGKTKSDIAKCCDCGNHQWGKEYESDGKWYRKCKECSKRKTVSAPATTKPAQADNTLSPPAGNAITKAELYPLYDPVAGSPYMVRVVTNGNVARLSAVNNDGTGLKETWSVSDGDSGTRIWRREYTPGSASDGRYWQITAYAKDGGVLGTMKTNAVDILEPEEYGQSQPQRISIGIPWEQQTLYVPAPILLTATVTGGSGDFVCEWTFYDEQTDEVFRLFTTNEPILKTVVNKIGKWQVGVSVSDVKTSESAETSAGIITVKCRHPQGSVENDICVDCGADIIKDQYYEALRTTSYYNPLEDEEIYLLLQERLVKDLSPDDAKMLLDTLKHSARDFQAIYLYTMFEYSIIDSNFGGTPNFYYPDGGIRFDIDEKDAVTTYFHESGHAADYYLVNDIGYYLSVSDEYIERLFTAMQNDVRKDIVKRMISMGYSKSKAEWIASLLVEGRGAELNSKEDLKILDDLNNHYIMDEDIGWYFLNPGMFNSIQGKGVTVSDIYGGITNNYILGYADRPGVDVGFGHPSDYWYKENGEPTYHQNHELWAEYCSAYIRNDTDEVDLMGCMLSESCEIIREMVADAADMMREKSR